MRAIEASTEADVIDAGLAGLLASAFDPDKALHFQYTSGPLPVLKVT